MTGLSSSNLLVDQIVSVELRLVPIEVVHSLSHGCIIDSSNDSNEDVQKDDEVDQDVSDPEAPDNGHHHSVFNVSEARPVVILWRCEISNGVPKGLKENHRKAREINVVSLIKVKVHYFGRKSKNEE